MLRRISEILELLPCLETCRSESERKNRQDLKREKHRGRRGKISADGMRRDVSRNGLPSRSSYASSNLDEPGPLVTWSAYNPKDGVSWAPTPAHTASRGPIEPAGRQEEDVIGVKTSKKFSLKRTLSRSFRTFHGSMQSLSPKHSKGNGTTTTTTTTTTTAGVEKSPTHKRFCGDEVSPQKRRSTHADCTPRESCNSQTRATSSGYIGMYRAESRVPNHSGNPRTLSANEPNDPGGKSTTSCCGKTTPESMPTYHSKAIGVSDDLHHCDGKLKDLVGHGDCSMTSSIHLCIATESDRSPKVDDNKCSDTIAGFGDISVGLTESSPGDSKSTPSKSERSSSYQGTLKSPRLRRDSSKGRIFPLNRMHSLDLDLSFLDSSSSVEEPNLSRGKTKGGFAYSYRRATKASVEDLLDEKDAEVYLSLLRCKMYTSLESFPEFFEDSYIDEPLSVTEDEVDVDVLHDGCTLEWSCHKSFPFSQQSYCLASPSPGAEVNFDFEFELESVVFDQAEGDGENTSLNTTNPVSLDYHKTDEDKEFKAFVDGNDLSRILITREELRTGRQIYKGQTHCFCEGSFSPNRNAISYSTQPVSVQILRFLNSEEDRINLLKNVLLLRQLSHANILRVLGVCLEGSPYTRDGKEVLMATEKLHYLVSLQRLLRWTRENNPKLMSPSCAAVLSLQLCEGLHFLEQQKVIHTNLSSATVRLDVHCTIKIGGVESHPVSTTECHLRWQALETLAHNKASRKSPVWTFGIILWELATVGTQPYPHLQKLADVQVYLIRGKRLIRPGGCSKTLYNIMLQCWNAKPKYRPSFGKLQRQMLDYQSSLPAAPALAELFPDREDFWDVLEDYLK